MRRAAALLVLLTLASCKEDPKPPEKTPAERGAAVFAPAVDKLGEAIAADMKKQKEDWYQNYLKETGSKTEAELGRALGAKMLPECLPFLHLTAAQEADLKAGKFDERENLRRASAAIQHLAGEGAVVSLLTKTIVQKVKSGEWSTGLMLDFATRMLEGHIRSGAHKH